MGKKTLLALILGIGLSHQAYAIYTSGWELSSSSMWRLKDDPSYSINKNSPAKIADLEKVIFHQEARIKLNPSITSAYTFKVGCVYQSKTPAFEIDVPTLSISINDQNKGYSFARFLVDKGQEYSLRGEVLAPNRLVFSPITQSQQKKLSDLFMQISEGGALHIAILQGVNFKPKVFTVPLAGFFELSQKVVESCNSLNSSIQNYKGEVNFLPDYLTKEPNTAAPKNYTLKPKKATDGLSNQTQEPVVEPEVAQTATSTPVEEKPEIKPFTPGGGVASIGDDGKPISATQSGQTSDTDSLGESKGQMQIGDDGKPISSTN